METQYTFRERVQRWVENHPDIERWVRLVSPAFLYDALDDRLSFHDALTQALQKRIPSFARRRTLCLGGIALLLFINQITTVGREAGAGGSLRQHSSYGHWDMSG